MKGRRIFFAGLVLSAIAGWAMGYLRLPYLEKDDSFWLGFVAALAAGSLALLLAGAWKGRLWTVPGGRTAENPPRRRRIVRLLTGIVLVGGLLGGLYLYRGYEAMRQQLRQQEQTIRQLADLAESVKRKSELAPLMQNVLNDVWQALQRNPGRTLSDTAIARITALSFSFKPYRRIEADTLSGNEYSPERGQLLLALALMNIDSVSFARVKKEAPFEGADLRGANLKGCDLSGINLKGANLKDADLSGADLSGAVLGGANLWGANLERANLSRADLKRADLRWARLNEAVLPLANLNGANLTNAQLVKADLYDALFQWGQASGALFSEANLSSVNFVGTDLTRGNLTRANLSETDLRKINLSGAELAGAYLDKALVEKNWFEKLRAWRPAGEQEVLTNYTVENDAFDSWGRPMHHVRKVEKDSL